jgi:hypothetical protein
VTSTSVDTDNQIYVPEPKCTATFWKRTNNRRCNRLFIFYYQLRKYNQLEAILETLKTIGWFRWLHGLRLGSVVARLRGSRVRNRSLAWVSVSCDYNVSSGRVLCEGAIPRPEESYRVCVFVTRCNNNPLQLQWSGKIGQAKKEIRKF